MRAQATSKQPKSTRPQMAGYGLPKSKKGLLPWKWAEDRLKKSKQYWIATSRPDGRPHVMVVWALWMDGVLYFSTGKESRKGENMIALKDPVFYLGPKVAFGFWEKKFAPTATRWLFN